MIGANPQQAHDELAHLRDRAAKVWSEGALQLVFERSPDAILLLDDGVFIDCNQAAVNMLRAAGKDELLLLSPSDLSPAIQPDGTSSANKTQQMIDVALEPRETGQRFFFKINQLRSVAWTENAVATVT